MSAQEKDQLTESEETTEKEKDPAQVDYENGVEFLTNKNFSQAANAFHNALIGFEQSENKEGLANACDKLGDICSESEEFEKALEHYDKSYEICQSFDDFFSLNALRKKKATCFEGLGRHKDAINTYMDLLEIYQHLKDPASSVSCLLKIAEMYQELDEVRNAIDAYKTAAAVHSNFGHKLKAKELHDKAADLENGISCQG